MLIQIAAQKGEFLKLSYQAQMYEVNRRPNSLLS